MEEYEWDDMTDEMSLECVGLSEIEQGKRERSLGQECELNRMKTVRK